MLLEYNTRFGDPETEAILMRLESDLLDLFEAALDGRAATLRLRHRPGAAVSIVAASPGYPGPYPTGAPIHGLPSAHPTAEVQVFHAGTARDPAGHIVTAGGRVLAVTAQADDGLEAALARAYATLNTIDFAGIHYRRDIGWRALPRTTR